MNAGTYETKQILLARLKTQMIKNRKAQIEYKRNDKSFQVTFSTSSLSSGLNSNVSTTATIRNASNTEPTCQAAATTFTVNQENSINAE